MKFFRQKHRAGWLALAFAAVLATGPAAANGPIGDHVEDLQAHLGEYAAEVQWLIEQVDGIVDTYELKGAEAAEPAAVVDHWEAVKVHAAIEVNYVPVYASVWQGLFGVREAIEKEKPIAEVREQQAALEQALWQGLGAVKLAAQYQQKGLTADKEGGADQGPVATLGEVKHRLDRVVAKYAEQLVDEATTIVHETYATRFEGVEGELIEQDAELVADLEKDFNVTLPQALQRGASVDEVRGVVNSMHAKLDRAISLLAEAEDSKRSVF